MAKMDARVEDYLNDKLQTFADFETLDALIANVQSQQALLQKQLDDARQVYANAKSAADKKAREALGKAQAFEKKQADIDKKLLIVTQSETSDDAVQRFEQSMQRLHRLDVAEGYFSTLQTVDSTCERAKSQLKKSPEDALQSYNELYTLVSNLDDLQVEAEGAAPHLLDYVHKSAEQVRGTVLDLLSSNLESLLKKLLWPKPNVAIPESLQESWDTAVNRLLLLQKPELEALIAKPPNNEQGGQPIVLLPLEILVKPLEARFQYHFSGNRPTNRLDKPEYFLSHILELLNSHVGFIEDYVQPCLLQQFRNSPLMSYMAYLDATTAFITALLPMVRARAKSILPQVSKQPQLFSHFIRELIKFDDALRDEWRYTTMSEFDNSQWRGLTWEVLTLQGWFGHWLQVERDFALSRYDAIIDPPENSALDYDSLEANATKPTRAALLIKDLLETITKRYLPLSSFSQKISFLIDIQVAILDKFHARLNSSLEAFLSLNSTIGRTVQGVSAADLSNIQGVQGLDRICRVFGSADLLERAMRDWSDDVLFVRLWMELQARSGQKKAGARYAASSSRARNDIEERAAELLKLPPSGAEPGGEAEGEGEAEIEVDGALFDETANAYGRVRARSESTLAETVSNNLREALRPYIRSNPWSSQSLPGGSSSSGSAETDITPMTPSIDLSPALTLLRAQLGFLKKALAPLPLRKVGRHVVKFLNTRLFDRFLLGHTFSALGAQQVRVDLDALMAVFEISVGNGVGSRGMSKCMDAVKLLTLTTTTLKKEGQEWRGQEEGAKTATSTSANTHGYEVDADADADAAAWGAEEGITTNTAATADDDGGTDVDGENDEGVMGLWEAERRIFANNESARRALDELDIEFLTENEARQVLQRRIELSHR